MNRITIKEGENKRLLQENISGETEIICKKNSKLEYFTITTNETELNITVVLEEQSELIMKNITILNNQKQKNNIKIIHSGKETKSNLENKAIISNSDVEIKGLIQIQENAEESEGYQKTEILILKDSKAISIPDLEIKNNNVKCSHSASITRLDEEKIFYLQTRGINKKEASALIINAFIEDALNGIEEKQKQEILGKISKKIIVMEKEA
ncbi:MAG: SufD family Fe-S cluster assembly protein [Candidatus Nanoarchaeia archaeon]